MEVKGVVTAVWGLKVWDEKPTLVSGTALLFCDVGILCRVYNADWEMAKSSLLN